LYAFKLAQLASFANKNSLELLTQKRAKFSLVRIMKQDIIIITLANNFMKDHIYHRSHTHKLSSCEIKTLKKYHHKYAGGSPGA